MMTARAVGVRSAPIDLQPFDVEDDVGHAASPFAATAVWPPPR